MDAIVYANGAALAAAAAATVSWGAMRTKISDLRAHLHALQSGTVPALEKRVRALEIQIAKLEARAD